MPDKVYLTPAELVVRYKRAVTASTRTTERYTRGVGSDVHQAAARTADAIAAMMEKKRPAG